MMNAFDIVIQCNTMNTLSLSLSLSLSISLSLSLYLSLSLSLSPDYYVTGTKTVIHNL